MLLSLIMQPMGLLLYRIVLCDYVMLCNSVYVSVTTWFLCTIPVFMYMVALYQML